MNRRVLINVSESFAVLCTFWNISPEEIIRFYLKHVSMSEMARRLGIDLKSKSELSEGELKTIKRQLFNDPFIVATYFTICFVYSKEVDILPKKVPNIKLSLQEPIKISRWGKM